VKATWVRPGGPRVPDGAKARSLGIDTFVWDATDPQIDSSFFGEVRSWGFKPGITRDPSWLNMTADILAQLEKLMGQMEAWNGTLLDAAALDLEFHRVIWRATGNPYLERALNTLMVPLFAHKTLEHVSQEIRRWRLSHHRALLDLVAGVSAADPQEALLTHLRMSYTEPERYSTLAKAMGGPAAKPQGQV